ncbi:hypothetical protein Lalb_Chr01g0000121 [Lupinus albus]|uniref:TMEM205-like domain-containing protein n=1 Tax=Lupinus albus TaxID=3870 RepID=A0A6A4R2E4_LUPAL|nr:hypothetical protein Lalb_Chr01g0000121 [Lupinus albus]
MSTTKMVCSLVNLMLTSLALALEVKTTPSNTIVKDDHRVVVLEYDKDGHHYTKISISPPQQPPHNHHIIDNNHNIKEAVSFVQGGGGGGDSQNYDHDHDPTTFLHAPKELICDAYGICKHKIADAIGRAKDKISEKAHDAIHMEKDMIHAKKETLADAVGKAKETVYKTAHDVQKQTKESFDKGKETGQTLKEHVVGNVSEAKGYAVKHGATDYILGWMETVMRVVNLVGFAMAYGMNVWITFISSYVLSRAMPFGVVQSKIYPLYFRAMTYSIGIALLGHVLANRKRLFFNTPEMFQTYNLLASLFTLFINSLYLEPRAAKLISERMKIEKEEGRGIEDIMSSSRRQEHHHDHTTTTTTTREREGVEHDAAVKKRSRIMKLNEKLKRLNSYSSILNILNLISLTYHLLYLATKTCMD